MRILWVCNIMLPEIAGALDREIPAVGGWMSGLLHALAGSGQVELGVCFPTCEPGEPLSGKTQVRPVPDRLFESSDSSEGSDTSEGFASSGGSDTSERFSSFEASAFSRVSGLAGVSGSSMELSYYSFYQKRLVLEKYDLAVEEQIRGIIRKFKPDVVHIFGTEYLHSLAAVKAFGHPERTVIGIQGMVSVYARHFMADVPDWVRRGCTFRDLVKRDNLYRQQKSFVKRGEYERAAIRQVSHVLGRTDWDLACTREIHPDVNYHFCNEILRDSFYHARWKAEDCEPYSIFISQGSYPIKGFHFMLEALPEICSHYPEAKVYVAGGDITRKSWKDWLRQSSYGRYIEKLIEKYGLGERVIFTGFLSEEEVLKRYLRANVFVSPSSIENSPNSVGEAMLLGMPVVSSDVGGVKNLLTHGEEGYLYPCDAPYLLAWYVKQIFADVDRAKRLGEAAAIRAAGTYDQKKNAARMLAVYQEIGEGVNGAL